LTSCFPGGDNADLFASAADWVSPNRKGGWMRTPPANDGRKVVLLDTDHLWGIGGDAAWVWRSVLNGHQPLYMDPLDEDPAREEARRAMGVARKLAEEVALASMVPRPALASSGCCLAPATASHGRRELLAWSPRRRTGVDLRDLSGPATLEWVHPVSGDALAAVAMPVGRRLRVTAPWADGAVARVSSAK
jgi:hypothetical protein